MTTALENENPCEARVKSGYLSDAGSADAEVSSSLADTLRRLFPAGQILRYLGVGVWNTIFGYLCYAASVFLFRHLLPHDKLPLTADIAYVAATPVSITMSYLCYKFFVFKTQGNYLREWLRCFAVYGTGMIPVLVALPVLTRALQTIHTLPSSAAPLLAGVITTGFTTIYSYIGHRNFSFRQRRTTN